MEATPSILSQLRGGQITLAEALELLVNSDRQINFHLIDPDLVKRFADSVRRFLRKNAYLPPVVPLLLWRNCYYLGSPIGLSDLEMVDLKIMLKTDVCIIPIAEKSYRNWFRCFDVKEILENLDPVYLSILNEVESEQDMTEAAEAALTFAHNQTDRVKSLITQAVSLRASDIHLEPTAAGLVVRFRIDGILRDITSLSPEIGRRVVVAIKVMSDMNIAETRRPQDGRISDAYHLGLNELDVSIRVSTLPCIVAKSNTPSEKVVFRLLRQKNSFTAIEDLGFSELAATTYKKWIRQPQGIIIFTGPTGSGKTSTLYTTLQTIATREKNISTIEDPVEYSINGVTQTQVLEAAGMTFAAGLRSILRQDPDVVMVGEIRDADTAITAVRAALTGHLVLTTLHANDALGAIPRLKNLGVEPGLISDALLGIVSQRLIRRICPYCRTPYHPTGFETQVFDISPEEMENWNWQKGKGCVKCFNSGYLGREGIFELLDVDEYVRSAIQGYDLEDLRQYITEFDDLSFRRAAIEKVKAGTTDIEEILRVLPESSIGTQKRSQKRKAAVEINADFISLNANEQNMSADFVNMTSQELAETSTKQTEPDPSADLGYSAVEHDDEPSYFVQTTEPANCNWNPAEKDREEELNDPEPCLNSSQDLSTEEGIDDQLISIFRIEISQTQFELQVDAIVSSELFQELQVNNLNNNDNDTIDRSSSTNNASDNRTEDSNPDQSSSIARPSFELLWQELPSNKPEAPLTPVTYTDAPVPYGLEDTTALLPTVNQSHKQQIDTDPDFFVDFADSQIQAIFNDLVKSSTGEPMENITIDFNILLEDVVYKIHTRYAKPIRTRMKKLLQAVCTGHWPTGNEEFNGVTFSNLINKTLQIYPQKASLEACLRIIVRNLNKTEIYENVVEQLLHLLQEVYYLQEWHQMLTNTRRHPELKQL
jgi:type II secretory ATPase GspE/PulE/Tfp pilus assembly ATPase PilB-like protein